MAQSAAGICQAIGMLAVGGIQEDARGFQRLRRQHHRIRFDFHGLARIAIDVEHASGAITLRVHQHLVSHGVGNQSAIAARQGVGHGGKDGVEIRMRHAAWWQGPNNGTGPGRSGLGDVGGARGRDHPAQL